MEKIKQIKLDYSKLADEFIQEHNNKKQWTPFNGFEKIAIKMFADWLNLKDKSDG